MTDEFRFLSDLSNPSVSGQHWTTYPSLGAREHWSTYLSEFHDYPYRAYLQHFQGSEYAFVGASQLRENVLEKLREYTNLPSGWEFGVGEPMQPQVYYTARNMYLALYPTWPKADVFPCTDGSVYLVFYCAAHSLEVCIWTDRTVDVSVEEDVAGKVRVLKSEEGIPYYEATKKVGEYLLELEQWRLSESFITDTTTKNADVFVAHVSGRQETGGSLSLIQIVPQKKRFQSVSTS